MLDETQRNVRTPNGTVCQIFVATASRYQSAIKKKYRENIFMFLHPAL